MSVPGGFVDRNYRIVPDFARDVDPETIEPPKAAGPWNDTVKLERPGYITLANKIIVNEHEDCIDGVRVHNCYVARCTLSVGNTGITLKGGSADNKFFLIGFRPGPRSKCEIELGQFDNYWYPGRPPTRRNSFVECWRDDGRPIRVRLWDADDSNVFDSTTGVKITRIPKPIWFTYFLYRYAQLRIVNLYLRLRGRKTVATS